MSWFFFAFICVLGWGFADLFYKRGTDESDRYSHLKIAVWVGLVMGVCALLLLPLAETQDWSIVSLLDKAVRYAPASLAYIISMVIGYAGLRYLELSIVSPVQNASGALSAIAMLVYFIAVGRIGGFWESYSALDAIGALLIAGGVIALGVVEHRLADREKKAVATAADPEEAAKNRKYRYGALALLFPILYCVFDTVGTAADGIILDEETGLGIGEIDVLVLYGLTFLVAGIVCWLVLLARTKKPYNPFAFRTEWPKAGAAVFEEFGQVFYVYAMAKEPVLAAPMVASYCIVSVILSRLFLKEKLKAGQYACIFAVIAGIVLLGISEGLAEA